MSNNRTNANRPAVPANPNQPAAESSDRQAQPAQASATSPTTSDEPTPVEEASLVMAAAKQYGGSLTQFSAQLAEQGVSMGEALALNVFGDGLAAGVMKGQAAVIDSMSSRLLDAQSEKIRERIENFTVTTASAVGGISPSRNTPDLKSLF